MLDREVQQFLAERRMSASTGFLEKLRLKVLQEVERAVERARQEGRAVLEAKDLPLREAKALRVRYLPSQEQAPPKPIIQRESSRAGMVRIIERRRDL